MEQFFVIDWSFIDRFGENPFLAMWFLFLNGGWIVFAYFMAWGAVTMFVSYKQNIFNAKKRFIVLAIQVPRLHEQTARAAENMFAYIAGSHTPNTWTEQWIIGRTQDRISMEIVSIDGHVQFLVHTTDKMRDLIEAAVFSQYPDAEITEVEDYAKKVPAQYPDEEWDVFGTELIPVKSDVYPLKTYPMFEDKVSGEFKDPIGALLEGFSHLVPGEQAWLQIVLTPIGQPDFQKKADAAIKKMKGEVTPAKKTLLDHVVDFPIKAISTVAETALGAGAPEKPKSASAGAPKIMGMAQSEKDIIDAIAMKASKIVFLCKIRFLYVAKKQIMSKPRVVYPFIGAIKQFNTNNMQSLKPESKKVGVSGALWWFKTARNNGRKTRLMLAYRGRSNWAGTPNFHLNTEELATLWHFPITMQFRPPQLKKTEAKKSEPPENIPFG